MERGTAAGAAGDVTEVGTGATVGVAESVVAGMGVGVAACVVVGVRSEDEV